MSNIENISFADVLKGRYSNDPINTVLIQIADPDMDFPCPRHDFYIVRQFNFLDLNEDAKDTPSSIHLITQQQAKDIINTLESALKLGIDVTVHCTAGLCRSGAVAEVGEMIGYKYIGKTKQPNSYVKKMLLTEVGYYDNLFK